MALIAATGCSSTRPKWLTGVAGQGFEYQYVIGQASDLSRSDALESAEADARLEAAVSNQMRIQASSTIITSGVNSNGVAAIRDSIRSVMQIEGAPATIRGWELYETYNELLSENRGYSAWVLYRFDRGADRRPPPSRFGWIAKSALLPGWGQRARGAKTRGNVFMTSFLGAGSSWVLLDQLRKREINNLNAAITAPAQQNALNRANMYGDLRNGILAALGAIWSISVVDAISGDSQLLPFRVFGTGSEHGMSLSIQVPF